MVLISWAQVNSEPPVELDEEEPVDEVDVEPDVVEPDVVVLDVVELVVEPVVELVEELVEDPEALVSSDLVPPPPQAPSATTAKSSRHDLINFTRTSALNSALSCAKEIQITSVYPI